MKVIWSRRALLDVEHTRDYIAQDSPAYANAFIAHHPPLAALSTQWPTDAGSRQFQHSRSHLPRLRIIYRLCPDTIEIVMVVHGSRDLSRFDKR